MEWKATRREKRGVWDWTPAEVEQGGMEAVLRCPVGWSGDHRVVSPSTGLWLLDEKVWELVMGIDADEVSWREPS